MISIQRGKINKPYKVVIYGPEGIGKTTLAAQFPDPLFIDTEGGTDRYDVARLPRPTSWAMILEEIDYIKQNRPCKTAVIDTGDWAEKLCTQAVCDANHWKSIETPGYGAGYKYVMEEYGKFLNRLTDLIEVGIHVVINCHAAMRKFEQPDEQGAYDRWELKLQNSAKCSIAAMVKEWADMLLFCNYKTIVTNVGTDKAKDYKATGGKRVMYTTHMPTWDAKNRDGLQDMLPMEYASIKAVIEGNTPAKAPAPVQAPAKKAEAPLKDLPEGEQVTIPGIAVPVRVEKAQEPPANTKSVPRYVSDPQKIPQALRDLMEQNDVTEEEIQEACHVRGYYPPGTPIQNMNPGFVSGCLVAAFEQVFGIIKEIRTKDGVEFK